MREIETSPIEDIEMIKGLCKLEAEIINMMFDINDFLGVDMLMNSVQSFETFLRSQNKMFVRGLSIEYRTFVTTLLTLIDERYRGIATAKILMN
ncbi:MAG: hypothetical protein PHT07_10330 [Paludibacter sp.]|nr:hypothetical protein [Paludibacter sp.]